VANKNPYTEESIEPRFYVKKRDDFNWEDLDEDV
jgi:hypothetical protein|tara:strand:+ start:489 stop:590 length:102 start_codon:yes stop_codon:yes gene_type:complete